MRTNEGYIIIKSENIYNDNKGEIVLGYNPKSKMYVTWECQNKINYFWGHYIDIEARAVTDYYSRLKEYAEREIENEDI